MAARNHPLGQQFVAYMIRGDMPEGVGPAEAIQGAAGDRRKRRGGKPVPKTVWKVSVDDDDPWKGAADALVTIVEFSDFECPYCSRINPTIQRIASDSDRASATSSGTW